MSVLRWTKIRGVDPSFQVSFLYCAKQEEAYLPDVKVREFILLMRDEGAKITPGEAVPKPSVLCSKYEEEGERGRKG